MGWPTSVKSTLGELWDASSMLSETCVVFGAAMPIVSGAQVLVDPIAVGVELPSSFVVAIAPRTRGGLLTMAGGCGVRCGCCCCFFL